MQPKVLILDEPTAGLDPVGKQEILSLILELKKSILETVIIISHDMDEISDIADRIAVFHKAKVQYVDSPRKLFNHSQELIDIGLDVPHVISLKEMLKSRGVDIPEHILKIEEFVEYICDLYYRKMREDE